MNRKSTDALGAVLVVEDYPVVRQGLVTFFEKRLSVQEVLEADCFEAATKILTKQKVDLAIFDLGIPGLGSALELAQVRRKWPSTKLVVLSGSDARTDILAALEAGVHGYFIKTASMDILANRIGQIMAGEIYVPPRLAELDNSVRTVPSGGGGARVDRSLHDKLTPRQLEVLHFLVEGLGNREIAAKLGRSESMAKSHVAGVVKALGARNRAHAAAIGRSLLGLV